MRKLMFRFSGVLVAVFIFVGQISPFCWIGHYQPEVPESLRK